MANLAIKGHATRGSEVIAWLEMLGGKNRVQREGNNKDMFYYIDKDGHIQITCGSLNYTLFSLEEFEKKYPYKIGDKVIYKFYNTYVTDTIKSMKWYANGVVYTLKTCEEEVMAEDLQFYKKAEIIRKFRKKPVEAIQFNGWNFGKINDWMLGITGIYPSCFEETMIIETLEGNMVANVGDYIIKGVQGEFYPCKPDIFEQTYDEVV